MDYVVTYDINTETTIGQRRLSRVAKICEGFGVRVQYSVFECRLSNTTHAKLVQKLTDAVDPSVDSIRLYRIQGDVADARQTIGSTDRLGADDPWIL